VSAGLFALVFGFSHAETTSWGNHVTLASLVTGAVLLALFAVIQSRSEHPLLPLRVVTNRNRAGSFLTVGIAGSAVFAVFLFLTYYLQQGRGYSPVATGLAFLPMTAAVMLSAAVATNKLRPRFALLSTLATAALTSYITSAHAHPTQLLLAHAAVHGYVTAFAWAAAIFAIGAVITGALFERGTKALEIEPAAAPALAH
jgi:hypothetical protein